ncbi:hypothetical protein FCR2A7T_27420 [Flavobacterium cauense R2A-7]|nr:hypothetical protein FCR2A7T_27420 [Flavobacterium cauense R2A-7]
MKAGSFITVVYKYTEKFERKDLTSEKKVQTLTITDKHPKPRLHKTAVVRRFYLILNLDKTSKTSSGFF